MEIKRIKHFSEWINEAKKPIPGDSINVFDIDDSLVVTSAKIKVINSDTGEEFSLTPAEFNEYEKKPSHKLDFSDFDDMEILKNGQLIEWVVDILRKTMKKGKAVGIITARSAGSKALREFFLHHKIDIHPELIFSVNDPEESFTGDVAERKKQAFKRLIDMGYSKFKFFDDDLKNLQYAKDLEKEYPIKMGVRHILPKWRPSIKESFEGRVLEKGIYKEEQRFWALFAHISDFYNKAKSKKELMDKFLDAQQLSIKFSKSRKTNAWPMNAVMYFYNWHLDRIKDKNRVKKAVALATECKDLHMSGDITIV